MDHSYIDDHQVVERYVLGQLPPDEAARFEEHSLVCAECLDRLEMADELRLGLRHLAAEKAAADAADIAGAVVRLGLLARLVRSRAAPWALALGLLAALAPSGLLLREIGERDRELAETREALARETRETPRTPPADRAAEIAALRTAAAESARQAETERRERERLAAELAESRRPLLNVPIVPLSPERSGESTEPTTRVALSPAAEWIVLALQLEATPGARHRASLSGPGGQVVWQSAGLWSDPAGTLSVALPAALFAPGVFKVEVEELPPAGEPIPAGELSFRIVQGR